MTITSPVAGSLPLDEATVKEIAALNVLNCKKEEVPFGSIFEDQKTLVIFVRHFFCGSCQAYITQLCNLVRQEDLDKAGIRTVLVGSGGPDVFDYYREATGFKGDIYTNPSLDLYRALHMTFTTATTPEDQIRKSYLTTSKLVNALLSIWEGVKNPFLVAHTGTISQNGGELVLGPGFQCSFASIMQHTEDHTEVVELMQAAGVDISS